MIVHRAPSYASVMPLAEVKVGLPFVLDGCFVKSVIASGAIDSAPPT